MRTFQVGPLRFQLAAENSLVTGDTDARRRAGVRRTPDHKVLFELRSGAAEALRSIANPWRQAVWCSTTSSSTTWWEEPTSSRGGSFTRWTSTPSPHGLPTLLALDPPSRSRTDFEIILRQRSRDQGATMRTELLLGNEKPLEETLGEFEDPILLGRARAAHERQTDGGNPPFTRPVTFRLGV